jgi:hypothetical protein
MAKFCSCGSIFVNGMCSNKNCKKSELEIDLLNIQERINNYCTNDVIKKKLKKFNGYIPFMSKYNGLLDTLDNKEFTLKGTELKALKSFKIPLNITLAIKFTDDNDENFEEISFVKVTAPSLKEVRGKINKIMPYIIKLEMYAPSDDMGFDVYFGSFNETKWYIISDDFAPDEEIKRTLDQVYAAVKIQYALANNWSIYTKDENDVLGMKVMIGKNKVKEIFKLRDIEDGKQRRTALRHIVGKHTKIVNDSEIDVLSYFRGTTKFSCDGLQYELIPSLKDLRIIEKEQRKMKVK